MNDFRDKIVADLFLLIDINGLNGKRWHDNLSDYMIGKLEHSGMALSHPEEHGRLVNTVYWYWSITQLIFWYLMNQTVCPIIRLEINWMDETSCLQRHVIRCGAEV